MSVVSVKVGGRRGKELIAPIVMNGTYTAIRRVQEARRKEILQVRQGYGGPVGLAGRTLEVLARLESTGFIFEHKTPRINYTKKISANFQFTIYDV